MIMNNQILRRVDREHHINKFQFCIPISYFPEQYMNRAKRDNRKNVSVHDWNLIYPNTVKQNDNEFDDRIRSFLQGTNPYRLPNGTVIDTVPRGYKERNPGSERGISPLRINAIKLMYPQNCFVEDRGKIYMVEKIKEEYSPPTLSPLGYRLLGVITWNGELKSPSFAECDQNSRKRMWNKHKKTVLQFLNTPFSFQINRNEEPLSPRIMDINLTERLIKDFGKE